MSRGYWSVIFALVGILTVSGLGYGTYQIYKAAEQQHFNYRYQPAREARAVQIERGKSPAPSHQPNCQNPQSNPAADLCAQWAAVDQVTESNRMASLNLKFAIFSLIFTVTGTLLLVWTLLETRSTSRRELRAYVFPESVGIYALIDQKPASENGKVGSTVLIKNSGQTPAYDERHWCEVAIHAVADEKTLQPPSLDAIPTNTIPPNGTVHAHRRLAAKLTKAEIAKLVRGELAIYVFGRIEYRDAFGDKRFTDYKLAYAGWPIPENMTMSFAVTGNTAN